MKRCCHRLLLGAALAFLLGVGSCARSHGVCSEARDDAHPVDPTLLAFLSRAKSAHHLADLKEDTDPKAALTVLIAVVDGPIPRENGRAPDEAREVVADTQARIAELQSRLLQFDAALARIDAALQVVPEINYFRGHLFETRGLVEQRHSETLHRAGDDTLAQAARSRALVAFETAMQVQAEVIQQTPATSTSALAPTNPTATNPTATNIGATATASSNDSGVNHP